MTFSSYTPYCFQLYLHSKNFPKSSTEEITNLFILDGDFHSDKIVPGIFLLTAYAHYKRSVTRIETGKSIVRGNFDHTGEKIKSE
tara:strand:+ start:404 stop:658 length:255 start_codon:yes stop_codon:yes gene_type:complete